MNLQQLRYVVAVADHGGFTSAAQAMHVAQPSLSQAIRTLEVELGVELFHRSTRSVRLTPAGEAFIDPARQALRDVATAQASVDEVVGLQAGHLDLVSLPTLAVHPVAQLVGTFRVAHPQVSVRLVEPEDTAAVAHRVLDGTSEIGITELPAHRAGLVAHDLGSQEFVALVPTDMARQLGSNPRITLATLIRQPLITTPPGTSTRRQLDESIAAAGLDVTVGVETDHREAIGPLVTAGAGVAIVPRESAALVASDAVQVREISPRISRRIGMIHRDGPLSPGAAAFVALALESPPTRARPRARRRT